MDQLPAFGSTGNINYQFNSIRLIHVPVLMKISKKRILFFTARSDTNGPMICVWTHDIRRDHLTPIRLFHVPEHISQSVLHKIWPGGENMWPYSMQNAVYETKTLSRKSRKSVLKIFTGKHLCVYANVCFNYKF